MKKYLSKRGFSLIELLVVVAIIAVLTAVVLGSIYSSREKARDAKRVSDIAQLQLALEQFFDKNRDYPTDAEWNANPNILIAQGFISVIPTAPSPSTYTYYVRNDNFDYILKTQLERYSEVLLDSLYYTGTPANYSGSITCLNNSANREYCVGPK